MIEKKMPDKCGRAWVEVDLSALKHNISTIQSIIPDETEIMAIVKANAYGHGVEHISEFLVNEGIKIFAVATITEGIELRRHVKAEKILVLGYTQPQDAGFLNDNQLSQLITEYDYAETLNKTGFKLNIHLAIDTGMHRLGMQSESTDEIEKIFSLKNLTVEGIATHLSSSDGTDESDVKFTEMQLNKFDDTVNKLKNKGYNVGKTHTQASYGIFNYPDRKYDQIRPGIMLYGIKSQNDETKIKTDLKPVLSLKATVAQVRRIDAGEHVSYGRSYTADKPIKTATVNIGYADGVPRQMSGNGGICIVKGIKVPVIGRICMDMLMLDVTEIEDIESGDVVTLIGRDGDEEIHCEDFAEASGTITNHILTGLGSRLPRIYI